MTAAARVMAAFTGEKADWPPFTLILSLYGARLTGAPVRRHDTDPALYAQGQARVAELLAPDIIFAPFALARSPLPIILHHGGNPATPFLPVVKDLLNVAGFVIGPGDSFDEARAIVGEGRPLLGDCQARMDRLTAGAHVCRVDGHNCCDIVLGGEEYRRLRREGAFFILPEWSVRWQDIFRKRFGFETRESARLFMQEMHRRIVYLDTGVMPVPSATLAEMGSYFGLPVEVLAVAPDLLVDAVTRALEGSHD